MGLLELVTRESGLFGCIIRLTKWGVEDKNGDGFSWLREIEVTHLKEQRFEGRKLNLAEPKRVVGGRKVMGLRLVLREGREEEDRSLSMAFLSV